MGLAINWLLGFSASPNVRPGHYSINLNGEGRCFCTAKEKRFALQDFSECPPADIIIHLAVGKSRSRRSRLRQLRSAYWHMHFGFGPAYLCCLHINKSDWRRPVLLPCKSTGLLRADLCYNVWGRTFEEALKREALLFCFTKAPDFFIQIYVIICKNITPLNFACGESIRPRLG